MDTLSVPTIPIVKHEVLLVPCESKARAVRFWYIIFMSQEYLGHKNDVPGLPVQKYRMYEVYTKNWRARLHDNPYSGT